MTSQTTQISSPLSLHVRKSTNVSSVRAVNLRSRQHLANEMDSNIISNIESLLAEDKIILVEETNCKKKVWKKFRWIFYKEKNDFIYKDKMCPRGRFAVCNDCRQVCQLGPRGGTSLLEQHQCPTQALVPGLFSLSQPPKDKNQAENERKEKIRDLNKDAATLILGYEKNLPQLTVAFLIWAALSEIPSTILQFLTDGKAPEKRPLTFYKKLVEVLEELLERVKQDEFKAANYHQQQLRGFSTVTEESCRNPSLHLHLVYPAPDDNQMTVTWFPEDDEIDRINMIGRNLSELIHPEDYPEIASRLLGSPLVEKDFSFPECRIITKPTRPRQRTIADYRTVFLTGHIRQIIRTPAPEKDTNQSITLAYSWPRLASFIHISTYYQYMTLHSLDGRIIQADKRITMVAGYECDEVINQSAHDFIEDRFTSTVQKKHYSWIEGRGHPSITFPLKAKDGKILYIKSRGEFIYYRDSNNQLIQGFILNNCLIDEKEHIAEIEWNSFPTSGNDNNVSLLHNVEVELPSGDSSYTSMTSDSSFVSVNSSYGINDFDSQQHNTTSHTNDVCTSYFPDLMLWDDPESHHMFIDTTENLQSPTTIFNNQPQLSPPQDDDSWSLLDLSS